MLPQEDRDVLHEWQIGNPDKFLRNETFRMLQKQLVSHPPTLAIRTFFSFVQATERKIRAKALEIKLTFTQDDRAMLRCWVTENFGTIPTNEDVKFLQRKMDINAQLGQIWNSLILLQRKEAERHGDM